MMALMMEALLEQQGAMMTLMMEALLKRQGAMMALMMEALLGQQGAMMALMMEALLEQQGTSLLPAGWEGPSYSGPQAGTASCSTSLPVRHYLQDGRRAAEHTPHTGLVRGCKVKVYWPTDDARSLTELAVQMQKAALGSKTVGNYQPKARAFMAFCEEKRREWLLATGGSVRLYIAHLLDKGKVQAASMQPYLSAINDYHEDMGFPRPAKGWAVSRAVKGMSALQVQAAEAAGEEQTVRTWLPARHVSAVHEHGLGLEPVGRAATELLRACAYVVFAFVTFGRPDTGLPMRREHISITCDEISVVLDREKGRGHVRLRRRLTIPAAGVAGLVQLLQHWEQMRDASWGQRPVTGSGVQCSYWRLPWERGKLQLAQANGWVQLALGKLGCVPSDGGHFSGHNTRMGACTCARAVGTALEKCFFLDGWSQLSSAIHSYINPTAVPDEHMEKYFRWATHRWQQQQPGTRQCAK
ncbi:hypothetical protein CYMTET_47996 [Cymbomonas tetramitiformis]|uniref:Integrase SAM-like N-terminal domain-containing protein n=1 Tax=Cymbomonas tetramitiformis TaxID=36881 RepID=A0AAE0BT41_9CHLO|nr:hypothetical protein CYMTET_47996 [Cymbomonas tetramitiformis]